MTAQCWGLYRTAIHSPHLPETGAYHRDMGANCSSAPIPGPVLSLHGNPSRTCLQPHPISPAECTWPMGVSVENPPVCSVQHPHWWVRGRLAAGARQRELLLWGLLGSQAQPPRCPHPSACPGALGPVLCAMAWAVPHL